ncbi:MAG: Ig-like domain-containing protein [Sphingomicrobium sp.]
MSFTIPGVPGVLVTATEVAGKIEFSVDVIDTRASTGDLRALFFHINPAELPGLTVASANPLLKEWRVGNNNVLDLGDGATLAGKVKTGFDVGLEWGTPGGKKDDINFEVKFTLSNSTGDLTLDDLGGMVFGAKLDSVGGPGGTRNSTTKLLTTAPFAPDANDDARTIFEDNAAGLNSPSKTPTAVVINVLANDTDGDTPAQTLQIDHIIDGFGPSHGTIQIVNNMIEYTPDLDYSGTDEFWYCMTDGHGGQDSAKVTVTITAVADDPLITVTAVQGSTSTEMILTVTATQNDADGSEDISSINWSTVGFANGAVITPAGPVVAGPGLNSFMQEFTVTTAVGQDYDFDIDFAATSTESSNGDTEVGNYVQEIVIDYKTNQSTMNYVVTDQSIWDSGDEFVFDYDEFLGVDESFSATLGDDVITGTFLTGSASITAGFDVDVHFAGGQIDANIPIDITVNTTFNKTTDTVFVDSFLALGTGGNFITTGPEGHFILDFIFRASASLQASVLWIDVYNDSFGFDESMNIFNINSLSSPPDPWVLLGGIVNIGVAWPHISVTGETSGSGTSNDFLYATLDVDALAANFFPALAILDANPTDPNNFELLDLDVTAGLNIIQDFALSLATASAANLVLEDGTVIALTIGTQLRIDNATSHDLNGDGTVDMHIALDPNVELTNNTSLGGNLDADLWIPKNFDFSLVAEHFDIVSGPLVTVFNDTFTLEGVGSQNYEFFV